MNKFELGDFEGQDNLKKKKTISQIKNEVSVKVIESMEEKNKNKKESRQMHSEIMTENTVRKVLQNVLIDLEGQEEKLIDICNLKDSSSIDAFIDEYYKIINNMQNILDNQIDPYTGNDYDILKVRNIIESIIDEIKYTKNPIGYMKKMLSNQITSIESAIKLIEEIYYKNGQKYN